MTVVLSTVSAPGPSRPAASWSPRTEAGVAVAAAETKSTLAANDRAKAIERPSNPAGTAAVSLDKALSKAELASQVKELQVKMDKLNPALAFVVDQESGRAMIQLTDRNTKEVIQQFPTVAALQISKALDRFEKGQLVNRTA